MVWPVSVQITPKLASALNKNKLEPRKIIFFGLHVYYFYLTYRIRLENKRYFLNIQQVIPSARYETEQDKQGQCHHIQLLLSELYLPLQCLAIEEPGDNAQNHYMVNLSGK